MPAGRRKKKRPEPECRHKSERMVERRNWAIIYQCEDCGEIRTVKIAPEFQKALKSARRGRGPRW